MTELSAETKEQILLCTWESCSPDLEQPATRRSIFEEAVVSQGESKRQQLAIYLHDEHQRTADTLNAIPTPNSLGAKVCRDTVNRPTLFLQPIAHTIDCLY
jgi:hypothetical protein